MSLKEQYRRFRTWQKKPTYHWDKDVAEHCCPNCGHVFSGNYCPICGQQGGDGHITWRWVRESILEVWGMDSRSLPRTLLHLLLRPGYLIGDYISGHRHACYKPVNMLFIVALFYAIIMQFSGHDATVVELPDGVDYSIFETVFSWLDSHPAWGTMSLTMIMILPTYFLFRFAPRHSHHTLPESIFIQLFMSTLMLLCVLPSSFIDHLGWLIPFYYYFTYRQLFGYRPWGTLWRLLLCGFTWFLLLVIIVTPMLLIGTDTKNLLGTFVTPALLLVLVVILLTVGYRIGKHSSRKQTTDIQP